MKLSDQQERAIDIIDSGASAFLTGWAGTGKSTVTATSLGRSRARTDLCATTGIAALNLQQQFRERTGLVIKAHTIYRYAGIMLGPNPGQPFDEYFNWLEAKMNRSRRAAFTRVAHAERIIIDEVSMLPGRTLDYLDYHFRRIRGVDKPFGGVQMVMVGDFLQLPPVAKTGKYDWAFLSAAWRALNPVPLYLTQTFRQNDPVFVDALNDFRIGRVRGETAAALSARVARFPDRNIPRLFTHNAQVDKWNQYQLECIEDTDSLFFDAQTRGDDTQVDFLRKNLVTPERLELRRTARVMFTANISAMNGDMVAANGECGTVIDASHDCVTVRKDDGTELQVERHVWSYDPQSEDSATFEQFPLRLAYSMTIHKSQGLTLDSALIDIRAAREPGQAYVALSRLRSLSGLHLKDWFSGVFVSQEAIAFYKDLESRSAITS